MANTALRGCAGVGSEPVEGEAREKHASRPLLIASDAGAASDTVRCVLTGAGPLAAESAQSSWRGRTRIGLRGRFSAADAECRALGGGDKLSGKGGGGGRRQALGVERELGEDSRGALLLLWRLTTGAEAYDGVSSLYLMHFLF